MAQIVVRKFTCDRCNKPYNETETDAAADAQSHKPKVTFSLESYIPNEKAKSSPDLVKFEDICPKCQSRVLDLVYQIRLENREATASETSPTPKPDATIAEIVFTPDPAGKVDKAPEKMDNKSKGTRAGNPAEPTTPH